jgi:hypothetical protein
MTILSFGPICSLVLEPGGEEAVAVLLSGGGGHDSGVLGLFLIVVGAWHHLLTLPSLQAGARFTPVICSSHNPPYEQLLISVGVGAMTFNVIIWPCWCWSSASSYNPGAPTIHPMSSCSLAWQWVPCCPLFITAMKGGPCGIVELFLCISMMWCAYRGCWVLTR